jgi:hypothetical protein
VHRYLTGAHGQTQSLCRRPRLPLDTADVDGVTIDGRQFIPDNNFCLDTHRRLADSKTRRVLKEQDNCDGSTKSTCRDTDNEAEDVYRYALRTEHHYLCHRIVLFQPRERSDPRGA